MARADSQPLLLAAELDLPPVCTKERKASTWPEGSSPVAAVSGRAYQHLQQSSISPWQSLPIQGPLVAITHNITPALPVVEPEDASQKELDARIRQVMRDYKERMAERTRCHMGYPYNLDFDYSALEGLEKFAINNLGDAFLESNYGVHSREFEIGVLQWFARLWSIDEDEFWGYVTSCGTEGNLHGILVGRENLPDGVLLASRESHYSIFKAASMYRMECLKVDTLATGEMDYEHFAEQLAALNGRPAIVNVNVGTTVKGAVDDVDRVIDALHAAGYTQDTFYIHVDGALFGMMMPFIKQAPLVSFKKPIGSVSVSGHKFIGAPVPCGVVITRQKYIAALSSEVEYLNSRDATIMGSRNGHAPIFMWATLTRKGYNGMRKDVERCLRNAHCLKAMLQEAGVKAFMNELSCTVVFERPREESFVRKWQLACEGELAHVVVMPNIGIPKLEEFVKDLLASRTRHFLRAALKVSADACTTEGSDSDSV